MESITMRKPLITAALMAGTLTLTACGSAEDTVPDFTEETTSTSTTAVQADHPDNWHTLSDVAETVHNATGSCPTLLVEEESVGGCGDDTGYYMMALNVIGYMNASEGHKLSIASEARDEREVMLWGDGWSINCWGGDPVSNCGDIYDVVPSATWVDLDPGEGFELNAPDEPENGFSDGTHLVGTDIDPGTYRTDGGEGCYWERQSGLSGTSADRITNDFSREKKQTYVTIDPSDVAFESNRCGTWELVQ